MNIGALVIFVIVAFVIAAVIGQKSMARIRAEWREVAAKYGLQRSGDPKELWGAIDGVAVVVRTFTTGTGKNRRRWTEMALKTEDGVPAELGKDGFFRRALSLEDLEIGDVQFDQNVRLRGEEDAILAAFDEATRALVWRNVLAGWKYEYGTWTLQVGGFMKDSLGRTLETGLSLARALSQPTSEIPRRLGERVARDMTALVRKNALTRLVTGYREHPATRDALERARTDPDARVRFVAARHLDDVDTLVALVTAGVGAGGDEVDIAIAALLHLTATHSADPRVMGVLDHLGGTLAECRDTFRRAVAKAVADVPRPWAEATLVGLLGDEDDAIRVIAAESLGAVGTIAIAVPALVPLREKFLGGALKEAAKDAITRIQARAGNPDAGGLAVVDTVEAGRLALHED